MNKTGVTPLKYNGSMFFPNVFFCFGCPISVIERVHDLPQKLWVSGAIASLFLDIPALVRCCTRSAKRRNVTTTDLLHTIVCQNKYLGYLYFPRDFSYWGVSLNFCFISYWCHHSELNIWNSGLAKKSLFSLMTILVR